MIDLWVIQPCIPIKLYGIKIELLVSEHFRSLYIKRIPIVFGALVSSSNANITIDLFLFHRNKNNNVVVSQPLFNYS